MSETLREDGGEDLTLFRRILALLDERSLPYDVLDHDRVHTSEEAARVRGTRIEEAAKALVLCGRGSRDGRPVEEFFMCVVPGHKRLSLRRVKALLGFKKAALAHPDDVFRVTGCRVGAVPPFPILFNLPGYCDASILENERVVFSAASHYKSVRMLSADWRGVAGVTVLNLTEE